MHQDQLPLGLITYLMLDLLSSATTVWHIAAQFMRCASLRVLWHDSTDTDSELNDVLLCVCCGIAALILIMSQMMCSITLHPWRIYMEHLLLNLYPNSCEMAGQ